MASGMHSSMMFMKVLFHLFQLMSISEWSKREFQSVTSISSQARSQSARLYLHSDRVLAFIGLTDLKQIGARNHGMDAKTARGVC